jgi:hypothetical protein
MRRLLAMPAAAALLLGACSYDFQNPAEKLDSGEVTGRVVADAGAGLAGLASVAVRLRNSSSTTFTRANGAFFVLGLMPGRHTVVFDKPDADGNTAWVITRDVDVTWGSDGQPEGVMIGDVQVRYPVTISGTFSVPAWAAAASFSATQLLAYDDATGMSGVVGPDPAGVPGKDFAYSFVGLPVGAHALRFFVAGTQLDYTLTPYPVAYVLGPISKLVDPSQAGQEIPMGPVTLASPTGAIGKLRFKVELPAAVATAHTTTVAVTDAATGVAQTSCSAFSDGTRECDLPAGAYYVDVVTTPSDFTFYDPPRAIGIVSEGSTTDLGALYVLDANVLSEASNACITTADCGDVMRTCVDGTCRFTQPY